MYLYIVSAYLNHINNCYNYTFFTEKCNTLIYISSSKKIMDTCKNIDLLNILHKNN